MGSVVVRTRIAAARESCFDGALDVRMHEQSASFSGERLVPPGRLTGVLEEGDLVCFEGVHFGFRQRFCARITRVEYPTLFVDEMENGLFEWLRHVHRFEQEDGFTMMIDELEWRSPGGPLGVLADWLFLEGHMRRFVERKQSALAKLIENGGSRYERGELA